jgi:hypothetical protein
MKKHFEIEAGEETEFSSVNKRLRRPEKKWRGQRSDQDNSPTIYG